MQCRCMKTLYMYLLKLHVYNTCEPLCNRMMFDSTRDCHTCILIYKCKSDLLQDKREEKQIEMANRIREALHCGLKVLEDAFVQLELEHTGGNWGGGEGGGKGERREGRWEEEVGEEE